MRERFSFKDVFGIVLAVILLGIMVAFTWKMSSEQKQQQAELQENSHNQAKEDVYVKEQQEADRQLCIIGYDGERIYIENESEYAIDIEGYTVTVDGEVIYQAAAGEKVEAHGVVEVVYEQDENDNLCNVVSLYTAGNELLQQELLEELTGDNEKISFFVKEGEASSLIVSLYAPDGYEIYYTLDGTIPTEESLHYETEITIYPMNSEAPRLAVMPGISAVYSYEPSAVAKVALVKAVGIKEDGEVTPVYTKVFMPGFDNKKEYSGVPTIVIDAAEEDLFDYFNGIYVAGNGYEDALISGNATGGKANYFRNWIADATFYFFEADRNISFASEVFLQTEKDGFVDLPQKSLRITNGIDVAGSASLLSSLAVGSDSEFILDNAQNDYLIRMRALFVQKMLEQQELKMVKYVPCNLFVKDEYWGMYLLTNPGTADYIGMVEGIDASRIVTTADAAGRNEYLAFVDEISQLDLTVESNYEYVESKMDVKNYAYYVCTNVYVGNFNWDDGTLLAWKEKGSEESETGNPWHFMITDVHNSLALDEYSSYSINTYLNPRITENRLLLSLMRSERFQELFATTMNEVASVWFEKEQATEVLNALSSEYVDKVIATGGRFYGKMTEAAYQIRVQEIAKFIEQRNEYILRYTREFINLDRSQWQLDEVGELDE